VRSKERDKWRDEFLGFLMKQVQGHQQIAQNKGRMHRGSGSMKLSETENEEKEESSRKFRIPTERHRKNQIRQSERESNRRKSMNKGSKGVLVRGSMKYD